MFIDYAAPRLFCLHNYKEIIPRLRDTLLELRLHIETGARFGILFTIFFLNMKLAKFATQLIVENLHVYANRWPVIFILPFVFLFFFVHQLCGTPSLVRGFARSLLYVNTTRSTTVRFHVCAALPHCTSVRNPVCVRLCLPWLPHLSLPASPHPCQ